MSIGDVGQWPECPRCFSQFVEIAIDTREATWPDGDKGEPHARVKYVELPKDRWRFYARCYECDVEGPSCSDPWSAMDAFALGRRSLTMEEDGQ